MANGIVAWHAERLARNSIDGGRIIYLLDTGKLLDLKFPTLWFDNTPQGKFMLSIAFGQSKYYVDNLSENVARGMRQKIRNGVWPSLAPTGYTNNPKTRGIDIDPITSRLVHKSYEMFATGGYTYADIARFLAKHGIVRKNNRPVVLTKIKHILSNKFYIGLLEYKGEYHDGTQELFMPKELFQSVQRIIKERDHTCKKSHRLPYTGLVRCASCGGAITAEQHHKYYKTTGNHATYTYYRCTRKIRPCREPEITGSDMESQLRRVVASVAIPERFGTIWNRELAKDEQSEKVLATTRVQNIEVDLAQIDQSKIPCSTVI